VRITETCGCGASIDTEERGVSAAAWVMDAAERWRQNHRHDSRPLRATESDEQGHVRPETPERDPASTTASESERADEFGFGLGGAVIA
jgi:hypothetical protein